MLGERFKALHKEKDLSCAELTQCSGHSVSTIHGLKEGRSFNPGFVLIRDISRVLGIKLDEISKYIITHEKNPAEDIDLNMKQEIGDGAKMPEIELPKGRSR